MVVENAKYYVSWMRWQGQDGYALWIDEAYNSLYWSDAQGRIPFFSTLEEVYQLAEKLALQIEAQTPSPINLDSTAHWLQQPQKLPPAPCLYAWNFFDDISIATGASFAGNRKAPIRNRVFDLLYDYHGPWDGTHPPWKLQERKVLKRILQQGLRLYQKYAYRTTIDAVPLP